MCEDSREYTVEKPPSPVPDTEMPEEGMPLTSPFANARGPSPVPEAGSVDQQGTNGGSVPPNERSGSASGEDPEFGLVGNHTVVQLHQMPSTDTSRQHHLLRHSLPSDQRGQNVLFHFGVDTIAEAAKLIKKMSQRDLQAKFKAVYGARTFSNNNNWLRRKLFEAIGLDPSKGAVKKTGSGGTQRRRRQASKPASRPSSGPRSVRRARGDYSMMEDNHSAAEALLALGELAGLAAEGYDLDEIEASREAKTTASVAGEAENHRASYSEKQYETEERVAPASALDSRQVPGFKTEEPMAEGDELQWKLSPGLPVATQEVQHEDEEGSHAYGIASVLEWMAHMQRQAMALHAHAQHQNNGEMSPQLLAMAQMYMQMQMHMAALAQTNPAIAAQLMHMMAMAQQMQASAAHAASLGQNAAAQASLEAYQRMMMEGMHSLLGAAQPGSYADVADLFASMQPRTDMEAENPKSSDVIPDALHVEPQQQVHA